MKIKYLPLTAFLALSLCSSANISAETKSAYQKPEIQTINSYYKQYTLWQVKAIVKYLLSDNYNINYEDISDENYLVFDLGLDSLDMLEFTSYMMVYFNVNLNLVYVLNNAETYTVLTYSEMIYANLPEYPDE